MDRLEQLRGRTPDMVEDLREFVTVESPSSDVGATSRCIDVIAATGSKLLGHEPEIPRIDGRGHLLWRFGASTRVLLVGHLDTVWPRGTTDRWPFHVEGDRASGPGTFDMKSGIVQALHGLTTVADLDGTTVLLTSDEELGSPTSSALIRELASGAQAALILEPAEGGALKTGRKGVTIYGIEIGGRAAHAGLEPEKGINALIELAHQVTALSAMADPAVGTSVTPTIGRAGTAANVVPASARIEVDVRALTVAEQERIHRLMNTLEPHVDGATITVEGVPNRPPMEPAQSASLFERARRLAGSLGIGPLHGVTVGGASDGNFTAAEGCPTLDGLGGVGGGAHAEGEHILVSEMAPRAALLASLVEELLAEGSR